MAYTASPPSPVSLFLGNKDGYPIWKKQFSSILIQTTVARRKKHAKLCVFATTQDAGSQKKAGPDADTRIHWENEDEGWIGGSSSKPKEDELRAEAEKKNLMGDKFAELLNSSDSHYQ